MPKMIAASMAMALLLSGCATARPVVSSMVIFVNHQQGVDISFVGGRTDKGESLVSPGTLRYSPQPYVGPGVDGMSFRTEWVELKWQELDPARLAQTGKWTTLDSAARAAYFVEQRALPVKSARVDRDAVKMIYADGSSVDQRKKKDVSKMTYKDTLAFITDKEGKPDPKDRIEGYVDIVGYCKWLNEQLYFKDKSLCK